MCLTSSSDCSKCWNVSTDGCKKTQISNLTPILSEGVELFHTDRQTEIYDKTNSCFSEMSYGPT